jgi:hypothetical protein
MKYTCKWEVGRFDWLAFEIHLNELKFCQVFEAKAPKPPDSSKIANIKFFKRISPVVNVQKFSCLFEKTAAIFRF